MIAIKKDQLTRIGHVNKAIGFKGIMSCIIKVSHPEKLLKLQYLFLILEGLPVPFQIEDMEVFDDEIRVKFSEIENESDVKKLLRTEVYAEKIREKKKISIISWKDVTGYKAIDSVHGELGIIEEVLDYPQQMIARCFMNEKEILFPLNDHIVSEISEEEKIIYVDLPEGLLDIYL